MKILGISSHFHDAAACLYIDGEIAAEAEEERFTRLKHDASFPRHAIEFCLEVTGTAPDDVGGQAQLVQDDRGRSYVEARAARQRAPKIDEIPPDLDRSVAAYAERLRSLIDASRSISTRLILVTQPSLYPGAVTAEVDAMLWAGQADPAGSRYYSASAMSAMLQAFNETTLQACAEQAVECVDLAAEVPSDLTYFYDGVHLNTVGSRLVGAILSEYMARHP